MTGCIAEDEMIANQIVDSHYTFEQPLYRACNSFVKIVKKHKIVVFLQVIDIQNWFFRDQ